MAYAIKKCYKINKYFKSYIKIAEIYYYKSKCNPFIKVTSLSFSAGLFLRPSFLYSLPQKIHTKMHCNKVQLFLQISLLERVLLKISHKSLYILENGVPLNSINFV